MRFDTRASYRMFRLAQMMLCAAMLSACRGGDDATTAAPSAAVVANTVAGSIVEGTDLLAYVGQSKTVALSFKTSDGAAATKLSVSLPATSGWQSQTGALSCDTVAREGSCVLRLTYTPTQAAPAATLRLPYRYIDSAGASQGGSVTLNYRALAANAAVATAAPNPVPGIVGQTSTLTIDFATNDGTVASALAASLALPAGWNSDAANFSCERFGGGAPCRLTLRYAPTQSAPSSRFTINYSYVDSADKPQSDAISVGYSAAVPNSVRVDIGGANLASPDLVAVDPGDSQDVSFTFTSSDGNALADLRLAADASLPAGWTSDAPLSTFSCAEVTQDGKCQLVLHFRPAPEQSQAQQTLALNITYRNALGQSMSGNASIDYTSRIYRLYAAGTRDGLGVSQCWLKMADGATKYELNACDDPGAGIQPTGLRRMVISGSKAYVLDAPAAVVHVCDVGADGALLDCVNQINVPANVTWMAEVSGALYVLVGQGGASIYACPLGANAGCEQIKIDTGNIKLGAIDALASDDGALYLLDNLQLQYFRCVRLQGAGFDVQCESYGHNYTDVFTTMTVGQLSDASHVFMGANSSSGPLLINCAVGTTQCGAAWSISNNIASSLLDLQFAYNTATEPALYLLVSNERTSTRGVIRCKLANAKTDTNGIGDPVSCGAYTPFAPSTLGDPSGITLR
ncbi:hypothetical protein [Noviherbaspirillum pedocola]|uniref:Uncharacterized protein n=1 Tax=Noviherbaspirillum pedocola TaxID=2801341 RepID=A0A934SQJ9_9BURK|nr:hypothetical protein [Noviherbaspirillum pedocola]MBK4733672.1 hypothetical protein [Noviherbaspirillum pedocola]